MNSLIVLCLSVAVFLGVEARPRTAPWTELQKAKHVPFVGDIWSDCSKSGDPSKIVSVVITPDPPKKGVPLTINATVALSEQVTSGTVKIVVKYSIITVLNKAYALCDLLSQAGQKCPVAPGTYSSSITETIPGSAPSGKYSGNVEITDQNGQELGCINLALSL
ncbi:hypothetical protein EMCRGX_G031957 [Ephydatia muelleri]|eukprot:Em0018g45a